LRGGRSAWITLTASAVLVASFAVGMPLLYDHLRNSAARESAARTEEEPRVRPLYHDELLGPPLSFETPAFISIPSIGVDEEVREGSDDEDELYRLLAQGPIHLPHTGFPGQPGNCVISGHRTTYPRPFNRLDELKPGDSIFIRNPRGIYEYRVYQARYADPAENVTLQTEEPVLTLTTCAPEGRSTQRLVIRASLAAFTPVEELEK
jgi:LPXTG-site transpeptidase (sortase) family protein